MSEKKDTKLELTPEEQAAIETQRKEVEKLNKFREGYKTLVEETGFGWVVDTNSALNNPQLGIARAIK